MKSSVNTWVGLALVAAVAWALLTIKPAEQSLEALHLVPLASARSESARSEHEITLANLRGRVVLLNFWGTWCPPCRAEFPHIVELYHKWGRSRGVAVLAVSCSGGNDSGDLQSLREQTTAFLAATKADLPIYLDPDRRTRKAVAAAVGFRGYPLTLVLDRAGKIRATWVGYSPGREVEMDQTIERLLKEPAKPESIAANR